MQCIRCCYLHDFLKINCKKVTPNCSLFFFFYMYMDIDLEAKHRNDFNPDWNVYSFFFHYIHRNIYMVSIQYFWMCLLWYVMVGFGTQVVESRKVKLQPIPHFHSESWVFLKLEYKPSRMKQHTLSTWINLPLSFPIHLFAPSELHIWWTKFSNIVRKEDYSFWHNNNTLCWVHLIQ